MSEENQVSIFDGLYDPFAVRRKYLIPKWIRFFCWVFAIFFPLAMAAAVVSTFVSTINISIYGIHTTALFSLAGVACIIIFGIKGVAAIGLLWERNWAVKAAIADGILGIALCVYSLIFDSWTTTTTYNNFMSVHYNFRLELLLLVPYLIKMIRIRQQWEENKYGTQTALP